MIEPDGSPSAKYMLIGEQPGKEESYAIQAGVSPKYFIGPAGRRLWSIAKRLGITRETSYVTNVIPHLDKHISRYIDLKRKRILPEGEPYIQHLKDLVENFSGKVVILFGNYALFALTGQTGIIDWRGSPIPYGDKYLIPIIHPASILRTYLEPEKDWFIFQQDLKKAVRIASEGIRSWSTPIIRPSLSTCLTTIRKYKEYALKSNDSIGFDIETLRGTLDVTCFSLSFRKHSISIPLIAENGDYFSLQDEYLILKELAMVLEDSRIPIIGQNMTFDTHVMLRNYGITTKNILDTMVFQGMIMPFFPKGLDMIASLYTDIPYYKSDDSGKKRHQVKDGHWEGLWKYNAYDSLTCTMAWPIMKMELRRLGEITRHCAYRQASLVEPLLFMQEHGVNVDYEKVVALRTRYTEQYDQKLAELKEISGQDLNPNSPKQMKKYFYETLRLKPYLKGKKPTVDDNALQRIERKKGKGSEEAALIRTTRKHRKLSSTYLKRSIFDQEEDGSYRIRCNYSPITNFCRLASKKNLWGSGMNLQNWPISLREVLIPDPGYVIFHFDLAKAENTIVAFLSNDGEMKQAFRNNVNTHKVTAAGIHNCPIEEVSEEPNTSLTGNPEKSQYDDGKTMNHAGNYGISHRVLALNLLIPEAVAKELLDSFHASRPGIRRIFQENVKEDLQWKGYTETLKERRIPFRAGFTGHNLTNGYASIPQGTVGDIINKAMLDIYHSTEFPEIDLLLQIHDELVIQLPLEKGWSWIADAITFIRGTMLQPLRYGNEEFTLRVNSSMGLNCNSHSQETTKEISDELFDNKESLKQTLALFYDHLIKQKGEKNS